MATTLMPELPREFLAAARKGQAYALDAIRTWAQTVQSAIPELRTPQIPFADRLPKPETVLANAYDFAGQLLASQRHFAEELLKVTEPLMPAIDNGRNAPATRTAPQTPAAHTTTTPPPAPAAPTTTTPPRAPAAPTTTTPPRAPDALATATAPQAPAAPAIRTAPQAPAAPAARTAPEAPAADTAAARTPSTPRKASATSTPRTAPKAAASRRQTKPKAGS